MQLTLNKQSDAENRTSSFLSGFLTSSTPTLITPPVLWAPVTFVPSLNSNPCFVNIF